MGRDGVAVRCSLRLCAPVTRLCARPSLAAAVGGVAAAGAGLRGRAEEHLLRGQRRAGVGSATTSVTWRTTRRCGRSRTASSTSSGCSRSRPRSSRTTCTRTTCPPSMRSCVRVTSRLIGVQHHHAHLAACLAEYGEPAPAVGAIFDGTGYGTDGGTVVGRGDPVRRPARVRAGRHTLRARCRCRAGEQAATSQEPWRMACAWLWAAAGDAPALPRIAGRRASAERGVDAGGAAIVQTRTAARSARRRAWAACVTRSGRCAGSARRSPTRARRRSSSRPRAIPPSGAPMRCRCGRPAAWRSSTLASRSPRWPPTWPRAPRWARSLPEPPRSPARDRRRVPGARRHSPL